ncbi:MAG: hypothetical protein EPN93_06575 [Spirochaetes bacterium]|nr:MAG: hypothetical protein EPN93_06575 [Spirochaetota bacterium]
MTIKRTRYVLNKRLQYALAMKIALVPLVTLLIVTVILFAYARRSANYINEIVGTQDAIIEMFLTTPALQKTDNPVIKTGQQTFKGNIQKLVEIRRNSELVLKIIVLAALLQTIIVVFVIIRLSHRITGPIYVMTGYLRELRGGGVPRLRPLRKRDEFKEFYEELRDLITRVITARPAEKKGGARPKKR